MTRGDDLVGVGVRGVASVAGDEDPGDVVPLEADAVVVDIFEENTWLMSLRLSVLQRVGEPASGDNREMV
ncbi:hypothetical protein ACIBQ1_18685 [Nonomuraea sp. NPDC050153]|uniref:hypothetical protein n=1 Tax=Nonomuraea sp. NPDC050153 TaxID=3364359 RepID=UPI0037952038